VLLNYVASCAVQQRPAGRLSFYLSLPDTFVSDLAFGNLFVVARHRFPPRDHCSHDDPLLPSTSSYFVDPVFETLDPRRQDDALWSQSRPVNEWFQAAPGELKRMQMLGR